MDTSLLDEATIEILKESAIIELGTLPGAHNFLREWGDEYSFSSFLWTPEQLASGKMGLPEETRQRLHQFLSSQASATK